MSLHIVDDEQRSDRRATPMRPSGSGLARTSASLALLDDVHRHRLRRAASHLPPPGRERGPFYYSDRLLDITLSRQGVCQGKTGNSVGRIPSPFSRSYRDSIISPASALIDTDLDLIPSGISGRAVLAKFR